MALDAEARGAAPQWAHHLMLHDRHLAAIDALVWALGAVEASPLPALPVDLAPFTRAERPSPEALVVTVTIDAEPLREIVLRLGDPIAAGGP